MDDSQKKSMNATVDGAEPGSDGVFQADPAQKLAGFLLILDADNAARIMGQLEESELEEVSSEMAKLPTISQELQSEILEEFSPVAVEATTAIAGGVDRVKVILEKAVGLFRASDILGRVSIAAPLGGRHAGNPGNGAARHIQRRSATNNSKLSRWWSATSRRKKPPKC